MERDEALNIAREHAGKSTAVIVISDGSVFFAPQSGFATYHAKEKGLNLFTFSNDELVSNEVVKKVVEKEIEVKSDESVEVVEEKKEEKSSEVKSDAKPKKNKH